MTLSALVNPSVLTQPVYEPGKPIDDVARELGLDPAGILKLASNENPLGPSPLAVAAATRALAHGELYPDGGCFVLRQKLAARHGLADLLCIEPSSDFGFGAGSGNEAQFGV
jgi:histidinol-phosphate aminotransferase